MQGTKVTTAVAVAVTVTVTVTGTGYEGFDSRVAGYGLLGAYEGMDCEDSDYQR